MEALNGNADAVREIVVRLPAKSVCRLRCVSKQWLSLLSDPIFLLAHAAAASAAPTGFCLHGRQTELYSMDGGGWGHPDPTLSFIDYRGLPPQPAASCNGLLLCRLPAKLESEPFVLSVCNPTTREHAVIPLPLDIGRVIIHRAFLHLAFDPRRSPHHTIFASVWAHGLEDQRVYKYSSETRSWKLLELGKMNYRPVYSRIIVYWRGSLVCSVNSEMLVALDVEGDQIRELPPPPPEGDMLSSLQSSGDRLHFIKVDRDHLRFQILEMAPDSSGWHVLHTVDLSSVAHLFDPKRRYTPLLHFIRGDDEDLLLLQQLDKIVSYRPQHKTFATICDQARPGLYGHVLFPLAHSLLPLYPSLCHEWVCWKSWNDRLLISLMVEQSRNGKKMPNGFQIDAWRYMVRMFNQATGLDYDVLHLANRLKSYRREYHTVRKILAVDGFHWSPSENVVSARCYGDWLKIVQRIPQALAYKRKQVPFEDLKIIFASSVRTGIKVSRNTCRRKQSGGRHDKHPLKL